MPVPDFQQFLLPVLSYAADGKEHRAADTIARLESAFNLDDVDRKEMIASGMPRFHNRVTWAITYLKKALLLKSAGRGLFQITDRGKEILAEKPESLTRKTLERFPEFVEFTRRTIEVENLNPLPTMTVSTSMTPEEQLEQAYKFYRKTLESEILERIKGASPFFFERLVVQLIVGMGYGGSLQDAGQATRRSGDDGVDGIVKEDALGLDVIHIQAKRWTTQNVGRPEVQNFAGSLEGQRGRKGVFITTSSFSADARDYVLRIEKKIVLIDGAKLAELCIDFGIGVLDRPQFRFRKLDESFFETE